LEDAEEMVSRDIPISIVMPVHNGMPYLSETVTSILNQTFPAFELHAIDDGSTDGTAAYLQSLKDNRIQYHRRNKLGLVSALNFGLEVSRAPLIARIDADDVAHPERLERQYTYLQENPQCVLLGCDFEEIDPDGRSVAEDAILYRLPYMATSDGGLRWQLLFGTPFLHPGVIFRKETVQQVGNYRKTYDGTAEDYDLWVRLAGVGQLASLPAKLMRKRVLPNSVSIIHMQKGGENSSQIALEYARHLSTSLDPSAFGELFWFVRGVTPAWEALDPLVGTFKNLRALFYGTKRWLGPDLTSAVESTEVGLRRRCLTHLRREWYRPGRMIGWLNAMKAFDPTGGRLRDVITRFVRKQLRKKDSGRPKQAPSPVC
jgi:glycosyltransferase involved in cell wall biosynthesis